MPSSIRLLHSLIFTTVLLVLSLSAAAHEIKPAVVDLNYYGGNTELESNELIVDIVLNLESLIADIGPEHENTDLSDNADYYQRLRTMDSNSLLMEFEAFKAQFISDIAITSKNGKTITLGLSSIAIPPVGDIKISRDSKVTLKSVLPVNTTALKWQSKKLFGEVIVRGNSDLIETGYAALLSPGQESDLIEFTAESKISKWRILRNYIVVGFEHILPKGVDHILFVIGVFLLIPAWRLLAIQVTVFTVAHSITLALAINGYLSVSAAIVEPLIALSIVVICIENYFTCNLSKWRIITIFAFGLIHGLGFASVLSAVGLDTNNFWVALLGFNIGVELGQLLVIAICMLGIGIWFRKHPHYRNLFSKPASIIVGIVGLFWFLQRVASLL